MTMDDPTTDLSRDPANVTLVVAGSLALATDVLKSYGVAVQANANIKIISNIADATAVLPLPADTPWCLVTDGLTDQAVRQMLYGRFGPAKTVAEALGVKNVGYAPNPKKYLPPPRN